MCGGLGLVQGQLEDVDAFWMQGRKTVSLLSLLKWHIEGLWPRSPPLVDAGQPGHRTGWGSFLGVSADQLLSGDPPTVALSYSPRRPDRKSVV